MAAGGQGADLALILRVAEENTQALTKIRSDIAGLGTAAESSAPHFNALAAAHTAANVAATAFAVSAAAVGGALAVSVDAAAGFEQTLSGIKAVSGATAEEMQQVSALALQLGKDTSFSASEAANGIEELVKGGLSLEDVMGGGASAALNLAAAGSLSVADAAEIAANAVGQFNIKGADLPHVADLIAGAANASSISVEDFKYSLASVGAVAATVGLTFDDTAVAIAEMGRQGIKGSDAGTSLKTMLLSLQPATKAQNAVFRELGLITADGSNQFFDAAGHVKSLAEIQRILAESTAGLTDAQRLSKLEVIGGTDAIRALSVLAKQGADGYNDMTEAMSKVTAADVAKERLNNLKGSVEQLKGSLETASITVGLALTPALKLLTDAATDMVNRAMPGIEAFATTLSTAVTSGNFQPLIASLQNIGQQIATQVATWGQAFADWVTPYIPGMLQQLGDAVVQIVASIGAQAPAIAAQLLTWGQAFVGWLAPYIGPFLAGLAGLAGQFLAWITAQVPSILAQLQLWGQQFVAWVAPQIPPLLAAAAALGASLVAWLGSQVAVLVAQLQLWGAEFIAWLPPQIPILLTALQGLGNDMMVWIATAAVALAVKLVDWQTAFVAWIANVLPTLPMELSKIGLAVGEWIIENAPGIGAKALEIGAQIVAGIISGLANLGGRVGAVISAGADEAIAVAKKNLGIQSPSIRFAQEVGVPIAQGIATGITIGQAAINAATASVTDDAVKAGADAVKSVASIAGLSFQQVRDKYNLVVPPLIGQTTATATTVKTIATAAIDTVKAAVSTKLTEVKAAADEVVKTISSQFDDLQAQVDGYTKAVTSMTTAPIDAQAQAWTKLAASIHKATNELAKYLKLSGKDDDGGHAASIGNAIGNAAIGALSSLLPSFGGGGVVPGPMGAPTLAVVHGGERITPNGGGGNIYVSVVNTGTLVSERDFETLVSNAIGKSVRNGRYLFGT